MAKLKKRAHWKLTPRSDNRWQKYFRGKYYYYQMLEGEEPEASYRRCWALFQADRDEALGISVDAERAKWTGKLQSLRELQHETEARAAALRARYETLQAYADQIKSQAGAFDADEAAALIAEALALADAAEHEPTAPAWHGPTEETAAALTVDDLCESFMQSVRAQADRGELSTARCGKLKIEIAHFRRHVGDIALSGLTSPLLASYREEQLAAVHRGEIKPATARDRLQAAKQLVNWAFQMEYLDARPRVLESNYTVSVPAGQITTFTDDEIKRLLGSASPRTQLYVLLSLNTGMGGKDISDLRWSEVDLSRGTITRKRSKSRRHTTAPTVCYALWAETRQLLEQQCDRTTDRVLLNQHGRPLQRERLSGSNSATASRNVPRAIAKCCKKAGISKPPGALRATAATKLGEHPEYSRFADYFLAHSPDKIADRHYVKPSQDQFDAALAWLGEQLPIGE